MLADKRRAVDPAPLRLDVVAQQLSFPVPLRLGTGGTRCIWMPVACRWRALSFVFQNINEIRRLRSLQIRCSSGEGGACHE